MELWYMYINIHFGVLFLRRTFWFDPSSIFRRFTASISLFLTFFFPVFNYVVIFILCKAFGVKCWRPCSISLDEWGLLHKLIRTWWFVYSQWQWIMCVIAFGRRSILVLPICLCVFLLSSSEWFIQATSQSPHLSVEIYIEGFYCFCFCLLSAKVVIILLSLGHLLLMILEIQYKALID